MDQQQISGQVRIYIASLAAYLAGKGYFFDADTWNIILFALATVGMSLWSAKALTRNSQKLSVKDMPGTLVVETHDEVPITAANKLAALPDVKAVLATKEIAEATPSGKVVASAPAT